MLRYKSTILYLIVLTVLVTSCGVGKNTTRKSMRTTSFMPNIVELRLDLDDFDRIGEEEVTITFNKYFGLFTFLKEVNGKEVDKNNINYIDLSGRSFIFLGTGLRRALFEMHVKYPQADLLIPVYTISETRNMFLGSETKKILKVKAYKLKDKVVTE